MHPLSPSKHTHDIFPPVPPSPSSQPRSGLQRRRAMQQQMKPPSSSPTKQTPSTVAFKPPPSPPPPPPPPPTYLPAASAAVQEAHRRRHQRHQQHSQSSEAQVARSVVQPRVDARPLPAEQQQHQGRPHRSSSNTQGHHGSRRRQQRPVIRRAVLDQQQQQQHPSAPPSSLSHHYPPEERPSSLHTRIQLHSHPHPDQLHTHGFLEAWICVRQEQQGDPAEVYEHSRPLDSVAWASLQDGQQLPPKLMTVHDCSFRSCTDLRGEWSNYRVRVSRNFSPLEETTLFPNNVQLLRTSSSSSHSHTTPPAPITTSGPSTGSSTTHSRSFAPSISRAFLNTHNKRPQAFHVEAPTPSDATRAATTSSSTNASCKASNSSSSSRTYRNSSQNRGSSVVVRRCHNARSLGDLVQLLADPTKIGILAHLANASRLLCHRPRRIWACLKARWGSEALHGLGFTPRRVSRLLQQRTILELYLPDELRASHHYRGSADAGIPAPTLSDDAVHAVLHSMATCWTCKRV